MNRTHRNRCFPDCVLIALLVFFFLNAICGAQALLLFVPTLDLGTVDPDRQPVTLAYTLNENVRRMDIRIEDFRGKVIQRVSLADLPAGEQTFDWPGKDDQGARLPDGRYRMVLLAVFEPQGSFETASVDLRLATLPEMPKALPALPPLEKDSHRIQGRISGLWRNDPEDDPRQVYEARANLNLEASYGDFTARARLAARDRKGDDLNTENTQMRLTQKLTDTEIRAVWRDDLGTLDDPLSLFSDFQTPRKKVGLRADWQRGLMAATLLGFQSEGDVPSEEDGAAGRLTVGAEDSWRAGLTFSQRRALDTWSDDGQKRTSRAYGVDLQVPLRFDLDLVMAYATTEADDVPEDRGYSIQARYDTGVLRLGAGHIHLGQDFAADFSDPLRQDTSDVDGWTLNADYLRSQVWRALNNLALSSRILISDRPSTKETLWESDTLVRFNWGQDTTWMFNWLQREDGPLRQINLRASLRHNWNRIWSSGLQGNYAETLSTATWNGIADVAFKTDATSLKVLWDAVRRDIDIDPDSPYYEYGLRLDAARGDWSANLILRYHQRTDFDGLNLYGRLTYQHTWLHRYAGLTYVALGNRSALETEERVELGMEVRF